jgi:menaquinone-9 beta-reductase
MEYDLAIVGGGLAGSSLGYALAKSGARVVIIERETVFRDRVRGEGMMPWGAAEAQALEILDPLLERCAHPIRWLTQPIDNRDVPATTASGLGFVNFYHPEMQQCLLDLAVAAGAELRRPAEATSVIPGDPATVLLREGTEEQRIVARLVVGADGRKSRVRAQAGFPFEQDPARIVLAGALYRGMIVPDDAIQMVLNPMVQRLSIVFPIGAGRYRAYLGFWHETHAMLSGAKDQAAFIDMSLSAGAVPGWFDRAEPIGPLASFAVPDSWTVHPYHEGIALIGDAAATSDPVWGSGLSLTLRDVRTLRDRLIANSDWDAAGHAYAEEHDIYAMSLHRMLALFRTLFFDTGLEADRQRAHAGLSGDWGDADGSDMTCLVEAGRGIVDGLGVAAGRNADG